MVEDFQDGAAGLPAELWAVVMSKLYNEAPFVGLRPEDAGYGGAGDLACSMRVNSVCLFLSVRSGSGDASEQPNVERL